MQKLMEEMILVAHEDNFEEFLKIILKSNLIIIDELGYLPLKPIYVNSFFRSRISC